MNRLPFVTRSHMSPSRNIVAIEACDLAQMMSNNNGSCISEVWYAIESTMHLLMYKLTDIGS